MACCEKCWEDAWEMSQYNFKDQPTNYKKLLEERKDSPCTAKEQAGQFWDEENQIDKRKIKLR